MLVQCAGEAFAELDGELIRSVRFFVCKALVDFSTASLAASHRASSFLQLHQHRFAETGVRSCRSTKAMPKDISDAYVDSTEHV